MRIVLSNASPAWGGIHQVTEILARGLQARGHRLLLLCRPGSRLEARMREIVPLAPVLRGMDLSPAALLQISRELRRFRPDAVLTLTKKDVRLAAPAARALGVPVVVRHANDQPIRAGMYGRALYGLLPALHVTNAEATRRTILRSAPWLPETRVRVIRNGVDVERFASASPADLGLPAGAVAVGYLGSFEPRKGLPDLADAWTRIEAEHPEAHLVLVGEGSQEGLLRERLRGAARVRFAGYRRDVPGAVRALDLLVLPSYVEGAPNVVLEAMAAGRPVVATAVSGTPELVEDGVTGNLVPPRDPAALAGAIGALLRDPARRAAMGAAGTERARREHSIPRMIDEYEDLLRRVSGAAD